MTADGVSFAAGALAGMWAMRLVRLRREKLARRKAQRDAERLARMRRIAE